MPLPTTAREELEGRIDVLKRDAQEFRDHAQNARALAGSHDDRAADYETRAADMTAILERAFPKT